MDRVMADSDDLTSPREARLTDRERDALTASAAGRDVPDVAELLGLTPAAVDDVIASAIERLGARSKLDAIRIAYRDGLIDLPGR